MKTINIPKLQTKKGFSQFGEEGLIHDALDWIGIRNRWCFEVGALDGIQFSNTRALREQGWNAILIEQDDKAFAKLEKNALTGDHLIHYQISSYSLDRILKNNGAPVDMDFGTIDIDGQDYWAWEGMSVYRPRLMLVEISTAGASSPIPPIGALGPAQAGVDDIDKLAKAKGYERIAITHCNGLYVAKENIP
jgi:hypothetical protein|tara:strand:+ start:924 stop:1499 length:576 start_codon:yes stop_codon:yes gene_type:complete